MTLIKTLLCVAALASLPALALAQGNGGVGAAGTVPSGQVDRVIVGGAGAAGADIGTAPSGDLYEGRSVAQGKRRCWVNVYGDRQCEASSTR
ncbi:MAG: hypothetical protein NVS2B5_14110 [Beijerinckiaceae bacterium]